MTVTVARLRAVAPATVYRTADEFENARSDYADAEETFRTRVENAISSGSAWSGGGRENADGVMDINTLALKIGKVQMDAAKKATSALGGALSTARAQLLVKLEEANAEHVTVNDDGSTDYVRSTSATPSSGGGSGGPYGSIAAANEPENTRRRLAAERLQREIQGILVFAGLADENCKGLLDSIADNLPRHSSSDDPSIVAHNRRVLDAAEANRDLAAGARRLWESAVPQPLPKEPGWWDNVMRGVGDFASHLWNNPGDAGALAVDGAAIAAGIGLMVLGAGGHVGGVAFDITGAGLVVGVPVHVASAAVITSGVVVAGAGAASLGQHLGQMNAEARGSGGESAPRYRPSDNARASRSYGRSSSDITGQARNFASRMRQRGFRADVPQVRYDKYGRADVTVAVYRNTKTGWVLHHIRHFLQK